MCFAPPKERNCHSHYSVELTLFWGEVLERFVGNRLAARVVSLSLLLAVPLPGSFAGNRPWFVDHSVVPADDLVPAIDHAADHRGGKRGAEPDLRGARFIQ